MTIREITKIPLYRVQQISSKTKLREMTQTLITAANKRMRRFEKTKREDIDISAYSTAIKGGKFSTRGLSDMADLYAEFVRVREFLKNESSTIAGAARAMKRKQEKLAAGGIDATVDQINEAEIIYRELVSEDPKIKEERNKYNIFEEIVETRIDNPNEDMNTIMLKMKARIERERKEAQKNDVSSFFGF